MNMITNIFREHTELAVFLTLALGFFVGKLRIGSFRLGEMLGALIAGMIVGQMDISIPPVVKIIFFDLFLFATGYKVGPQFFYGLKKDAIPQLLLTIIICTSCLITAVLVSKLLGYDVGTAAGLLAGAFSESTVIGTAGDAIQKLDLPENVKTGFINNIPVAYAVTYLVGTTANVWFLSTMAPKLLRIDLKKESQALSKKIAGSDEQGEEINSAFKEWRIRSFRISGKKIIGKTISEIENLQPGTRIIVERIRKQDKIMEPAPDIIMEDGDILVLAARQNVMVDLAFLVGEEVSDKELMDFPMIDMDIVVTRKGISGMRLKKIAEEYGHGIMLNKLRRGGQEMPFDPGTVIQSGDILQISGRKADVERTSKNLGFKEMQSSVTDIIFVATGIFLGGLIGLLSVNVGGIAITLSTSGGALLMGLIFGWLHSKTPAYGKVPEAALWIFDTLGLAVFLAIVGIAAGPTFISGLQKTGFAIIPAGLFVALLPHVIGLFAGRYLLKINPVILLGAQSGAGTSTTALKAIQDAAGSKLPVLGYTIPYALGNILLTAWGPVIVSLMTK
jgi:putative transport protein